MKDQEVNYIPIADLVLWTENPRDQIDENATDQEIADLAINSHQSRWKLSKLASEMGEYYDYSELPTVVYHGEKPVVYDGNRRMILGKIKHQLVQVDNTQNITIPDFPTNIPCNVCIERIALKNVLRKHGDSGSWNPLERDIFLNKYMGKRKSTFMIIEESTGLISAHPHLNKGFVKKEIFSNEHLIRMGFDVADGLLKTRHQDEEAKAILSDISKKIESKTITTRKQRGKILENLEPSNRELIDNNKKQSMHSFNYNFSPAGNEIALKKPRQSKRIKNVGHTLFGGELYLSAGLTNNLYRDISELHKFYTENDKTLDPSFFALIRMSLRLLCEMAANDLDQKMEEYTKENFIKGKKSLDQNTTTTLSTQNVTEKSIPQLLHVGAHNYTTASNKDQTIAISIILGAMLTITHGKDDIK